LNARFSKNPIPQLSRIFLRVDGDPEFFAGGDVPKQAVTALTASHFGIAGCLELPDYLAPCH